MELEFDPAKSEKNEENRRLPFTLAAEFDWETAAIILSPRNGEVRYHALGYLRGRIHALVFSPSGEKVRVISLRRANKREIQKYEKARPVHD